MGRAQSASTAAYPLYQNARIAGFNGDQTAAMDQIRDLPGTYQPTAVAGMGLSGLAAGNAANPGNYYQANQINPGQLGTPQNWTDAGVSDSYMSPYINNVLDRQIDRANELFGRQQVERQGARARSGAFGGYRDVVDNNIAYDLFGRQVADTTAQGLQSAYNSGMGQFNADRSMGTEVGKFNINTGLQGFQQNEAARQAEAQGRLGWNSQLGSLAKQIADQGYQLQEGELRSIGALKDSGLQQQQLDQASLDLAYGDFVNQRDWDKSQLGWLSGILHGVPVSANTTTSAYENPNPYSQLLGLGLNGLALNSALGSIGGKT